MLNRKLKRILPRVQKPARYVGGEWGAVVKDLDEVAYIRFACVHRQFKDINTFMDELKTLMNENGNK